MSQHASLWSRSVLVHACVRAHVCSACACVPAHGYARPCSYNTYSAPACQRLLLALRKSARLWKRFVRALLRWKDGADDEAHPLAHVLQRDPTQRTTLQ